MSSGDNGIIDEHKRNYSLAWPTGLYDVLAFHAAIY